MSSYQNGLSGGSQPRPGQSMDQTTATPIGRAAQQGAAEAMEFQLWVSQQATSLAKLKVFNTMAKTINDQQ
ncbi:hypothetical protein MJ904_08740 [Massilia sp. MB5]|uniref:Uncharacterized protein n=1 Tax=Pseudoduganella violacea TaxID=1715466 RepID=A0A7W5BFK3_9BURK|nr:MULTISPECIES: hypothetical protein [Telluria group]AKU24955.1 hypothetical protein ACZ75_17055 [Massilia sp. NR 4-1]MBB3121961.1 hypothetical protein [Pseudoduganella violacea]UMR32239.1 hypothetical protein MJ904_08740 [Massilia sp. MB5]